MKKSGSGDSLSRLVADKSETPCPRGRGLVGNGFPVEHGFRQREVEVLDAGVTYRHFRKDDGIDDEAGHIGGASDRLRRPVEPARILRHDVNEHVGVDQNSAVNRG